MISSINPSRHQRRRHRSDLPEWHRVVQCIAQRPWMVPSELVLKCESTVHEDETLLECESHAPETRCDMCNVSTECAVINCHRRSRPLRSAQGAAMTCVM